MLQSQKSPRLLGMLAIALLASFFACQSNLFARETCNASDNNTGQVALKADSSAPKCAPESSPQKIKISDAVILGIVEGLTEYLPVSSTGHLIITSHAMGISETKNETGPLGPKIEKNPAIDSFEIIIQIGAILAVVGLYRKDVGNMCLGLAGKSTEGFKLFKLLVIAFMPAAVFGVLLHSKISEYLFSPYTVAGALIVGGIAMIIIEKIFWTNRKDKSNESAIYSVTYMQALIIGFAQCLAMWPGTSRSMVTILAGVVLGLNLVTAAKFSFLLALPTLAGATVYSLYKDWHVLAESAGWDVIIIGTIVSTIAAAVAVKAFSTWLTKHGMVPFGYYRILLGIAVFAYFW